MKEQTRSIDLDTESVFHALCTMTIYTILLVKSKTAVLLGEQLLSGLRVTLFVILYRYLLQNLLFGFTETSLVTYWYLLWFTVIIQLWKNRQDLLLLDTEAVSHTFCTMKIYIILLVISKTTMIFVKQLLKSYFDYCV